MSDQMPLLVRIKRWLFQPVGQRHSGINAGYWCDHMHWDHEKQEYLFGHYCYATGFNVCPSCEANRPRLGEGRWGSPRND